MRDDVKIVEVIELKRTHHMAHGHPSNFCMLFADKRPMPIMNEVSHLLPTDDFKVERHYAKKFHINGEDRYIIWSMELETLVGMPLKLFDDLHYEVDQRKKDYVFMEDAREELRIEVHTQKVARNILGITLALVGVVAFMAGFNVI